METFLGVSLNDIVMVDPTVHYNLLTSSFAFECIALADVSKMYRAIELQPTDSNLHKLCGEPI